jgi:hypothetical protein
MFIPDGDQIICKTYMTELYLNSGAHQGLLGFPISNVQFDAQKAEQRFAGGKIEFLSVTPKGIATTSVRVCFVGFHCDRESDHDQLSDTDEPYFIIGVAGSNRSNTIRFGPYENIETGTDQFEATMLADPLSQNNPIIIVPPIVIGVVAIEHDAGTPEEAEEKVRNIIKAIEEKFDQAAATFFGIGTEENHVLPEWARDILIGWVPEGIAAVFGLGDDHIGSVPLVMFDFNPGLEKWTTPPGIGLHGQNPYNTEILVDGGSEGIYKLRFQVEIVNTNTVVG